MFAGTRQLYLDTSNSEIARMMNGFTMVAWVRFNDVTANREQEFVAIKSQTAKGAGPVLPSNTLTVQTQGPQDSTLNNTPRTHDRTPHVCPDLRELVISYALHIHPQVCLNHLIAFGEVCLRRPVFGMKESSVIWWHRVGTTLLLQCRTMARSIYGWTVSKNTFTRSSL
jgi:hypothetical protein